jgi:hypothetical protein
MSTASLHLDTLRKAIVNPTGGVVGLVDNVLALCREHQLQLDWRYDRCSVRSADFTKEEIIEVPLRKSVFRTILARVATLCSEKNPGSFSPYGGQGELSGSSDATGTLHAAWVNTPDEQRLELTHADVQCEPTIPQVETNPAVGSARHAEA